MRKLIHLHPDLYVHVLISTWKLVRRISTAKSTYDMYLPRGIALLIPPFHVEAILVSVHFENC